MMPQHKRSLQLFLISEASNELEKADAELDALKGWNPPPKVRSYRERMAERHKRRAHQFTLSAQMIGNMATRRV